MWDQSNQMIKTPPLGSSEPSQNDHKNYMQWPQMWSSTIKVTNPPTHPQSHPNLPPVYPPHPRWFHVGSAWSTRLRVPSWLDILIEVYLELWLHHDVSKEFWFWQLQADVRMDNTPAGTPAWCAGEAISTKILFVSFMYESKSSRKRIMKWRHDS